jgi:hypothetical protein
VRHSEICVENALDTMLPLCAYSCMTLYMFILCASCMLPLFLYVYSLIPFGTAQNTSSLIGVNMSLLWCFD